MCLSEEGRKRQIANLETKIFATHEAKETKPHHTASGKIIGIANKERLLCAIISKQRECSILGEEAEEESLELIFATSRGQKNEERTFDSSYAEGEEKEEEEEEKVIRK